MAHFDKARTIYYAICDDPHALAAIREARSALALSVATGADGTLQITSATMNGQTFSAMQGLKTTDRLSILGMICAMADAGMVPRKTAIPNFDGNS